jgi:hypothetical protein
MTWIVSTVTFSCNKNTFLGGCGNIGGKLNQTGTYTVLYIYEHLLIKH